MKILRVFEDLDVFLGILVILPEFFRNLKGLGRVPLDLQGFARYSWDLGRFLWIWIFFWYLEKFSLDLEGFEKFSGGLEKKILALERFGRVGKDLEAFLGIWNGFLWIWKEASSGAREGWVIGARFPCFSSNFMKTVQKFHQDFRTPKN